ncbi:pyridoxal phosphate-dependent class II aminotransferase [Sphingomonas ginsenosidivorax]|uniref:Aminotransferase n=1 Tax=Sphingomonas ginsenosidivorax TaxID=862135 RepID=A0A5C6UGM1_9SPHN|nr:aminotransferase class I/II-fold pyridoxal phosphate-dependent enzyme [Sphingomonas ginsenosidivorax]TXC71381.1 pyridoxal phosphate-dependent class II aminotransferase [Sphingomonas ginsenosidivorax]
MLTTHGGRIDLAAASYRHAPQPWIDLSTGINPNGWDASGVAIDWSPLPAVTALAALEAAARTAFGMSHGAVAALPGTEIGLRLLRDLGLPQPAHHVVPTYSTHAAALPDSQPIAVEAIGTAGTLLIANPNNPDGRILPPDQLLAIARDRRDGWLIVDEAFADIDPAISVLPHLREDDRVLAFRSFGKFFGLAGLRLGFVCGPDAMVARVRDRLGSWPVSAAAIAIGTAAYGDTDWIAATRRTLAASANRLDALLRTNGLAPQGDCPLFRLVDHDTAPALFDRLAAAGILTRPFDHDPRWLRIGLPGDEPAWTRLAEALRHG